MNASDARLLELALKKQRLQFASAELRDRLARNATVIAPICSGIDQTRAAGRWLRRHPAIPVAVAVALAVGRPRGTWRWARRGFVAWQSWQRLRRLVDSALGRRR